MENFLETPLKSPVNHSTIVLSGSKGVINWVPIMPRDALASRTAGVSFFQSEEQ